MNSARPRPPHGPEPGHGHGHDACGVGFIADLAGRARFDILPLALEALGRLDHRGAVGSDGETGDGAGVLTAIPWALLVAEPGNGIDADMAERGLGLASLFLPAGPREAAAAMDAIARGLARTGLRIAATRNVPTRDAVLGRLGRASKPRLIHAVIDRPESPDLDDDAWEHDDEMRDETRRFFAGASSLMEPWDGPALIAFSDGRVVGARLDRNGLRPARTLQTKDGLVFVGSEMGALDVPAESITERGRLGPGGFVGVDLERGGLVGRDALEARLARSPIGRGLDSADPTPGHVAIEPTALPSRSEPDVRTLKAFGYTREELQFVLGPMARDGVEPVGSMGDDTPLACLSDKPQLLFAYFKQRFAQVTNPPIDPLRERLVMSLHTSLGPLGSPFTSLASNGVPREMRLASPILSEQDLDRIEGFPDERGASLSLLFPAAAPEVEMGLERALDRVVLAAVREVRDGAQRVILTDRGVEPRYAALPSLLAVSAVHQRLIAEGLRLRASLIVESAEPRDDHQVAALLAFGANAVSPYGALAAARLFMREEGSGSVPSAGANVIQVLEKGLLKILSKMGIATLRSYQGAQLFETVGIDRDLVARHFTGTPGHIDGHGMAEIARDTIARHRAAFSEPSAHLDEGGAHRYRRNGEAHAYEPPVVKALHALIRSGERLDARRYAQIVAERPAIALRDLIRIRDLQDAAIPLEEVEPARAIFPRFSTAAMSLGSLSPEAHRSLAIAMNRIGALSNSGEGGESSGNYWATLPNGDRPNHRIKQVASARFGVTAEYLRAADELQIKIAQGSKPGEGGQLPGRKVVGEIARVRHAPEGATLISPPPHHDIYSIEDLAQLIHDLRSVNPAAAISVKLVSSSGIGAIAAGVVKAGADTIVIGGHDGGTGASPLSSIKNAGTPWEIGLIEVQETLLHQHLRSRVRLRVEGGLKTGRDVVIAAALGADEFAFGSAALVAAGCVMARQCHLNTCPVGIATQHEDLRRNFRASPEAAVRFVTAIAEETREILANVGRRSLEEIVGDASILAARDLGAQSRAARVSVAALLPVPGAAPVVASRATSARNGLEDSNPGPDVAVLRRMGQATPGRPLQISRPITVADRSVGARIAGEMAHTHRGQADPADALRLHFRGSAGQSFGAFATRGMTLTLEGEANDSVGKGLSGGEIVIRPRRLKVPEDASAVIAGNTILYGATSGLLFAAGRVGERFAVRLSGAVAVVEGAGDHACEYMTAGAVAILGAVGRNFGAGMTGGLAYVYDPEGTLMSRMNPALAASSRGLSEADGAWLHEACRRHFEATESPRAERLLGDWSQAVGSFVRVAPGDPALQPLAWDNVHHRDGDSRAVTLAILESVA